MNRSVWSLSRRSHRQSRRRVGSHHEVQATLEMLEPRHLLAGDLVISEFQAINVSTLQDEDGDYSDWIEIRNSGTQEASLAGWHLTDDADDLNKWAFPAVTIPGGGQIVVFASDKDRAAVDSELHTNFKLSGNGEYLGLVKPDGTVSNDFGEQYPPQLEDQSYGLAIGRNTVEMVSEGADVRAFVPVDDSLQDRWTQPDFSDAGWLEGDLGVGFESLYSGFEQTDNFDGPLNEKWTVSIPQGGNSTVSVVGEKLRFNVPSSGQDVEYDDRGTAPVVSRNLPGEGPADFEIITRVTQRSTDRGAAGIGVIDANTGQLAIQLEYYQRVNFRLIAGGESQGSRVRQSQDDYFLRLVRDGAERSWTGYYKLAEGDDWQEIGEAVDGFDGAPVVNSPRPAMYARTPNNVMRADFDFYQIIVPDQRPTYGPEIGLNLVNEMFNNNASAYLRIPFDAGADPSALNELTMSAQYDDGFRAYLNGTLVTEQNVPIEATWNSSATSSFGAVNGRIPTQQIDLRSHLGALRPGANVLAVHGMNVNSLDRDFFFNTQLVAAEILDESEKPFIVPTPGEPNRLPAAPVPVILGEQGVFFGTRLLELQIEDPNPSLEIRYTLDGSQPTPSSLLYEGPFPLTESAMLQARTFDVSPEPFFDPSNPVAGTFFALEEELRERDSDVPLVLLDSIGQRLPGSSSTSLRPVNVLVYDVSKATGRSKIDGNVEYLGRGGVRDRGSSTAGQPKPNMTFETWGANGTTQDDDEDISIGGLPADSDWVLHAPYNFDRAYLRNQFFMGLSNEIGVWAPRTRVVEVYFNQRNGIVEERDYMGSYVLMEKVKRGANRVDITEITRSDSDPNSEEITGGYIWKVDRADPGEPSFSAGGQGINWVEPKSPKGRADEDQRATDAQQDWVTDYFNNFLTALRTTDINDPEGYTKFIKVDSWVEQHLINVFTFNVDAFRLSAYFFKERNEPLTYGPLWDCDRCMESTDGRDDNPLKWADSGGTDFFNYTWFRELFRDPGFWQEYIDRWQELRRNEFSPENIDAMLNGLADEARESAQRNIAKWRASAPRPSSPYDSGKLDRTWEGEVEHMRHWLHARAGFMDGNFVGPVSFIVGDEVLGNEKGTRVEAGTSIEIQGPKVDAFDNPALISGEPGGAMASYFVPVNNEFGADWAKPDFDDTSWSKGPTGIGFDAPDGDHAELIRTQVRPQDYNENATTILSRIDFNVDDAAALDDNGLVLRMKYDDGFVAYLNGEEVLRANIRDEDLAWDSRARSRSDRLNANFEAFDLSDYKHLLVDGRNVLGIRMINSRATNSDMLMLADLSTTTFQVNPNATVYYTTDGTDPRGPDGMPSLSAVALPAGQKLNIDSNTRVIARNFDDVTDRGSEARIVLTDWSGPREYDFVVSGSQLAISEVNYNPGGTSQAEEDAGFGNDDFEFVELVNIGAAAADLTGVELVDGIEFDFINSSISSLGTAERLVVVRNQEAFQLRYGNDVPIAGEYNGTLDNDGEDIDLIDGTGDLVFSISYGDSDPWPVRADGFGATLELIDPMSVQPEQQNKWYRWRGSTDVHGSPGSEGSGPIGVVVNEVLARTERPVSLDDSIELHNTTGAPLDISGWGMSDSADDFYKFTVPAGTVISPSGYWVFDEDDFNPDTPPAGSNDFALNGRTGDDVWVVTADGSFVDDVHFRGTLNGESLARVPNSTGRLAPLRRPTFGLPNIDPRVGPVVMTEIQYNPALSEVALEIDPNLDPSDLEFVEIHNPTAVNVTLTDWRLRGGVEYNFGEGDNLAAGETIVLLKFNPADPENINQLNAFRAQYGINEEVRLMGGYRGQLSNADDRIVLLRPDGLVEEDSDDLIRVQEDEVLYDDLEPWPKSADGTGHSLQRSSVDAFGNIGQSWIATVPTPGSPDASLVGDFNFDGLINQIDINLLTDQMRSPTPDPSFDLTADGKVNADDRDTMIEDVVGTDFGDSNLDAVFNSTDLVIVFQAGEYEDEVALNSLWETGDWNGDGDFGSSDLVLAFQKGGYAPAGPGAVDFRAIAAALPHDIVDNAELNEMVTEQISVQENLRPLAIELIDESLESLFEADLELDEREMQELGRNLDEFGQLRGGV